jgi:hypothetical protein
MYQRPPRRIKVNEYCDRIVLNTYIKVMRRTTAKVSRRDTIFTTKIVSAIITVPLGVWSFIFPSLVTPNLHRPQWTITGGKY